MNNVMKQRARARLFRQLQLQAQRLLALGLAVFLCCGFLLIPTEAEDIHPPTQPSTSAEAQTPPASETESPPIQAPPAPETEAPPIQAPVVTEPPVTQPAPTYTVPGNTQGTEFPLTPTTEPGSAATGSTEPGSAATDPSSSGVPAPTEPKPVPIDLDINLTTHSAEPVSAGTPASNTYILEVSTGTVKDGGRAETVDYFVIYYTSGGEHSSTVIFPGTDGIERGMNAARAVGNRDARRQTVSQVFGYTTDPSTQQLGLNSVRTDQYLFTTPKQITTIDRIQIFGKKTAVMAEDGNSFSNVSDWSCQGMRVYEVNTLYGEEMYGWFSEEGYIDFAGYVIADVDMSSGGGTFRWNSSGGVFNIVPPGAGRGVAGCSLVNTANASTYTGNHHVGEDHISQATNRVFFQFDLADLGNAGFESLAGSYALGSETTVSDLKFCEVATLTLRYDDVFGCVRELDLPMIVNSLGWTMEQADKDLKIADFAQQGTCIALSAMLPDFASFRSAKLVLGESGAAARAGLKTTEAAAANSLRQSRVSASESDGISYVCFAAYSSASVNIQLQGATLRYIFTPGGKNPVKYCTSGSSNGNQMKAAAESTITLSSYHDSVVLKPVDRTEKYLLTISTDNTENCGTTANVYLQFKFINMKDKEVSSVEYNLRDYIRQFYGEWPGNTSEFAYNYGLRAGGTVQCMIPLTNVKQFKTVSVRIEGDDEWQFKGLQMQLVRSYDARTLVWEEVNDQGYKSHVRISRTVSALKQCFLVGQVYDDAHPALPPDDDNWKPGNLVQDDHNYHEFDGYSEEVDVRDEVDWSALRLFMTYDDACKDLGFRKVRCLYEVEVNVAGDKVNEDDDDCGSENLFYFQLVFDYGNSGCILANKQLQSDSFRTGEPTRFYIPTTMDYGELSSIRIIPDDQDDNSHIYDKLKIRSIVVRKKNVGKISPVWTAASDSEDGLGWVGIDPKDTGAAGSYRGSEGRSILELAHSYSITKSTYSTKLLFSITTGSYETHSVPRNGQNYTITDQQLVGGMSMSLSYKNQDGTVVPVAPFDIVKLMDEYSGKNSSTTRTIDGVSEDVNYCVSDVDYQFRAGKTDSFFVDVDDIASLTDAQIQIRSSVVTNWNITDITVHQVQASGTRYINSNGEYDYKYPANQGLIYKAAWSMDESLRTAVQIFRTHESNSIATIEFSFTENEFEKYNDSQWSSTVTREPPSKDDTLNLFLYPSTESAATDPDGYELFSEVLYTDSLTRSAQRVSTGSMGRSTTSDGRPIFYALGLNANYLDSIAGVNVFSQSARPVHVPISYGIMQRIRSGVLIDSYYLTGWGNADQGLTMDISQPTGGQNIQSVFLQFSSEMDEQTLVPDERDLAIALHFSTDDPFDGEFRSKYITLTDQGIDYISPGQVVELDFAIMNLQEIYGITMVNMGRLEDTVANAVVFEQAPNGAVKNKWSFRSTMTPARTPTRFEATANAPVALLQLDITTAESTGAYNSGVTGPVRMSVGFYRPEGNEDFLTFDDIRPFSAANETAFSAGATDRVQLLLPFATSVRWVELEPQVGDDGFSPIWKIDRVSSITDLSPLPVTRVLGDDGVAEQGSPKRISLAEILLGGVYSIVHSPEEEPPPSGDDTLPTGGTKDIALNVGEGIYIMPRLLGSESGVDIALNRVDSSGGLGAANLTDTRGYTSIMLEEFALEAEGKGNTHEAEFWRSVQPDNGVWEPIQSQDPVSGAYSVDYIRFIPPRNYTTNIINYRITITSRENSAARLIVNLSVPTETNPVPEQLARARAQDGSNENGDHTHNMQWVGAVSPTCTEAGHTEYYYCNGCGKYFSDAQGNTQIQDLSTTERPAVGHRYTDWSPASEPGKHTRSCLRCVDGTETVSCDFGDWVYDEASGKHVRTCRVCRQQQSEDCSYGEWQQEDASNHAHFCKICGHKQTETHNYDSGHVVAPTATEQGYTYYLCTRCQYRWVDPNSYTQPVPETPTEPTEPTDAPSP